MAAKETYLFLVADTSNSMSDSMAEINKALRQVIERAPKVSILTYANRAKWQVPPRSGWEDFKAAGNTNFAGVCEELNSMPYPAGDRLTTENYVIALFSDGESSFEYKDALEKLTNNLNFKKASKLVFAVGIKQTAAGFLH